MTITDVELTIARRVEGTTTVSMRVELPHQRVDSVRGMPVTITDAALAALAADADVYGATLTAMVFPSALREAWREARGYADGRGEALRVRLALEGDDSLHAIRWELLRDPLDSTPLAHSERRRLSRFLSTANYQPLQLPARPALRAVVTVANPATLATFGLPPVDVNGEVERAQQGLGEIPTTVLDGQEGRPAATLPATITALRDGAHILYLVCHGALVEGHPYLWLEHEGADRYEPVAGDKLLEAIVNLERRPLLIVLASCQGAGDTYQVLAAIGPKLAQAGVGAVLAMQGTVPMELVAQLTPRLFTELRRDGQIDRALAAARAALPDELPWWMPTLWMAVKHGALWHTPESGDVRGAGVFQVPYPPNPLFRGRDMELEKLASALLGATSGTAAVLPAVSGTGGIGKTQLASEFAHRHRDDFPGGVFWLNMAQPETVTSQVAAAGGPGGLDLPGWSGMDLEAKVAAVRRAWNEPARRLLVFDNLEEPRLLQEWRPTSGGTRVLITTRRGVWAASSGVRAVPLQTLARPQSIRLLLAPRYGELLETVLTEPTIATEADAICEQVGDLPLALALAGAYLEQFPSLSLAGYRARLANSLLAHPSLEAELEEGLPTRHAQSVAATIALSYQQLNPTKERDALALTLLQRVSHLPPAPIPHRLLARLVEHDPDDETQAAEVDGLLRRLVAVGLLELLDAAAVALHQLVGAYVRANELHAPGTDGETAALDAALLGEISWIKAHEDQLGKLFALLPHLRARALAQAGKDLETKVQLLNELGLLLRDYGGLAEAQEHLECALTSCLATDELRESDLHARVLNNLALVLQDQNDHEAARVLLEQALDLHIRHNGYLHNQVAQTLDSLALSLDMLDDEVGALARYEEARALRERLVGPWHPLYAESLGNLAIFHMDRGRLDEAEELLEQSETIFAADRANRLDLARVWHNLGELQHRRGMFDVAVGRFKQALSILEVTVAPSHVDLLGTRYFLAYSLFLQAEGFAMSDVGSEASNATALLQQARSEAQIVCSSGVELPVQTPVELPEPCALLADIEAALAKL